MSGHLDSFVLPYFVHYVSSSSQRCDGETHHHIIARSRINVPINNNDSSCISFDHLNNEFESVLSEVKERTEHLVGYTQSGFKIDIKTLTIMPISGVSHSDIPFIKKFFNDGPVCDSPMLLKQLYGAVVYGVDNLDQPLASIYVGYDFNVAVSDRYANYLKIKEPLLSLESSEKILDYVLGLATSPRFLSVGE